MTKEDVWVKTLLETINARMAARGPELIVGNDLLDDAEYAECRLATAVDVVDFASEVADAAVAKWEAKFRVKPPAKR